MVESYSAEQAAIADMPLQFRHGVEQTKAGERRYLDVEIMDNYSVWGTVNAARTEVWIEQVSAGEEVDDPRIVDNLDSSQVTEVLRQQFVTAFGCPE